MIAVVDSGVANLRSVSNALNHLGAQYHIAHTSDDLAGADKIILPGVGAFAAGMDQLRRRGFVRPLRRLAAQGVPVLGICLGMQLLFECSEEMGSHEGLGLLKGKIVRFPVSQQQIVIVELDLEGNEISTAGSFLLRVEGAVQFL